MAESSVMNNPTNSHALSLRVHSPQEKILDSPNNPSNHSSRYRSISLTLHCQCSPAISFTAFRSAAKSNPKRTRVVPSEYSKFSGKRSSIGEVIEIDVAEDIERGGVNRYSLHEGHVLPRPQLGEQLSHFSRHRWWKACLQDRIAMGVESSEA